MLKEAGNPCPRAGLLSSAWISMDRMVSELICHSGLIFAPGGLHEVCPTLAGASVGNEPPVLSLAAQDTDHLPQDFFCHHQLHGTISPSLIWRPASLRQRKHSLFKTMTLFEKKTCHIPAHNQQKWGREKRLSLGPPAPSSND